MSNLRAVDALPTLRTSRLLLREWREEDLSPFATMNSDPKVMEHFPHVLTIEQSHALVDRIIGEWHRGYGWWAVERLDTGCFIGFVGFQWPVWSAHFTPCVEIGWRLATPSWGNGFATEGATAALSWGRENIVFPRGEVVSFTTVANERSRRVMEKLGFSHDEADDFDHPLLPDWPDRRHVLYRKKIESTLTTQEAP